MPATAHARKFLISRPARRQVHGLLGIGDDGDPVIDDPSQDALVAAGQVNSFDLSQEAAADPNTSPLALQPGDPNLTAYNASVAAAGPPTQFIPAAAPNSTTSGTASSPAAIAAVAALPPGALPPGVTTGAIPGAPSSPSTPINWGGIAQIGTAVASLGTAAAGIYVADQNRKASASQAKDAQLQAMQKAIGLGSLPTWVLPVALAGGALLLLMALTGKKGGGSTPQYVFMPTPSASAKTNPRRRRRYSR